MQILKARRTSLGFRFRIFDKDLGILLPQRYNEEQIIEYLMEKIDGGEEIDIKKIIRETRSKGTSSFFDPPENVNGPW